MYTQIRIAAFLFTIILLDSCKKDTTTTPIIINTGCVLTEETNNLISNYKDWKYIYNTDGTLDSIKQYNAYGSLVSSVTITSTSVASSQNAFTYLYTGGNLFTANAAPTQSQVSFVLDNTLNTNYYTYTFNYDSKNRIVKILQTTAAVGDLEYALAITYNDQDNVKSLQYTITAGLTAGTVNAAITVNAYDNHPNPYSGIVNFRFLMHNYSWDNYDPGFVIAALSKNNPLDYAYNNDVHDTRVFNYTYNTQGLPVICDNINTNQNGTSTFRATWSYTCK